MALLDEYIDNGYNEGLEDSPGFLRNPEENADFLLRGLTRAGQDAMARDVFSKLSKKASRHKAFRSDKIDPEGGFVVAENVLPAYNGGEDLFKAYKNMPEDVGDSFLLTAKDIPTHFNVNLKEFPKGTSGYSMFNGNAYINSIKPRSIIHEYGHGTMQRLNTNFPLKVRSYPNPDAFTPNKLYVDEGVRNNIGKSTEDDLVNRYSLGYDENKYMEYPSLQFKMYRDFVDPLKERNKELATEVAGFVDDQTRLSPNSRILDVAGDAHNGLYKRRLQKMFSPLGHEVSSFAPMSMEGGAEIMRIMAIPGGAEWLQANLPNTYKKIIELMQNDHRKKTFRAPKKYKEIK